MERVLGALRHNVGLSVLTVAATGVVLTLVLKQYNVSQQLKKIIWSIKFSRRRLKEFKIVYSTGDDMTKSFADILQKDAARRHINGIQANLTEFNLGTLPPFEAKQGNLIVLIISTDSDGFQSSDNSWFHRWLQEGAHGCGDMKQLDYALVGVGDGTFNDTFCKVAFDIEKVLVTLGGQRIGHMCLIDRKMPDIRHGTPESAFIAWTEELWTGIESHYWKPFEKKPCSCSKKTCCTNDAVGSADDDRSGTRPIVDIEDLVTSSATLQTDRKIKQRSTHKHSSINISLHEDNKS